MPIAPKIAIDYFNAARFRIRVAHPALGVFEQWVDKPTADDMDGGVTAALIEQEIERPVDPEGDAAYWRARAEQAEKFAALWKEATRRASRMRQSLTDMYAGAFEQMEARAEKAEAERDQSRRTRRRLLGKVDALTSELRDTYHPPRAELIARAEQAQKERDEAQARSRVAFTRAREEQRARQEIADELYRLRTTLTEKKENAS